MVVIASSIRVRIQKVPPSAFLEGFDLRPYSFQAGMVYDLPHYLADVLLAWGYAALEMDWERMPTIGST
jgi:hypothetical protein